MYLKTLVNEYLGIYIYLPAQINFWNWTLLSLASQIFEILFSDTFHGETLFDVKNVF